MYRSRVCGRNSSRSACACSVRSCSSRRCQPWSTAVPEPAFRTDRARYRLSSTTSTCAPEPLSTARWSSPHRIFCGASWSREGISSGRIPSCIEYSASRADRFDDRTEAKVATARTSVPPAVASDAAAVASIGRTYPVDADASRRATDVVALAGSATTSGRLEVDEGTGGRTPRFTRRGDSGADVVDPPPDGGLVLQPHIQRAVSIEGPRRAEFDRSVENGV